MRGRPPLEPRWWRVFWNPFRTGVTARFSWAANAGRCSSLGFGSWLEGPDSQPADALVDGQEREVQPLSGAVPLVQGAAQAVRQRGRVLAPRRPAGPPLPGREQPVWSTAGGTYIRDPGLKTGVS